MGDDEDEDGDGDDEEQHGRRPHVHRHRAREEGVPTEEEEVRAVNFELILDWLSDAMSATQRGLLKYTQYLL